MTPGAAREKWDSWVPTIQGASASASKNYQSTRDAKGSTDWSPPRARKQLSASVNLLLGIPPMQH
jgi:hypothetical protein